jgi:hypothetical protein
MRGDAEAEMETSVITSGLHAENQTHVLLNTKQK